MEKQYKIVHCTEIRYNDAEHYTAVYAWLNDDKDESTGIIAAKVYSDGYVEWLREDLNSNPEVIMTVASVIENQFYDQMADEYNHLIY